MRTGMMLVLTGCVMASVWAEDGALTVRGGESPAAHVPVTVAYNGAGDMLFTGRNGQTYPATARNGELVIIVDELPPGASLELTPRIGTPPEGVNIQPRGDDAILDVIIGGALFTAYYYGEELKKPFLWPVNSEGGATVTRDWPMGEADRSKDHPHHVSLWTAYGDVNGVDCWATGANSGFQNAQNVTYGSGAAFGWIRSENVWQDKDRRNIVRETREYRFYNTPAAARLLDVMVTFSADFGDVRFKDTKEGGLVSVRMADQLCERGGTGVITTATGAVDESQAWGKPAAWCDYSGTLEGVGARGLAVFDNPNNLRYPTSWHVRSYGLMGANCFGYSYFTDGKENGDYTLPAGQKVTFNYRVYVHSGDVNDAMVAARYGDYIAPPSAEWK